MKAIIIGAGGFGKEIAFLLKNNPTYELSGFVDDSKKLGEMVVGKPILGNVDSLNKINQSTALFIGIASPVVKERIYTDLKDNPKLLFPNLIADSALIGINMEIGIGNILMPYTTYTADIVLGDFNMINISSTVGHDTKIGSYNSIYPSVNLSGNVKIGEKNEIGVGTKVIPSVSIGSENIIGAGSVVLKDIPSKTKSVGVPARIIESWG